MPFAIITHRVDKDGDTYTSVLENQLTRSKADAVRKTHRRAVQLSGKYCRATATDQSVKVTCSYYSKKASPWHPNNGGNGRADGGDALTARNGGKAGPGVWKPLFHIDCKAANTDACENEDGPYNEHGLRGGEFTTNPDGTTDLKSGVRADAASGGMARAEEPAGSGGDSGNSGDPSGDAGEPGGSSEGESSGEGGEASDGSPESPSAPQETEVSEEAAKSLEQFGDMGEAIKNAVEEATNSATEDLHDRITKPIQVTVNDQPVEMPEGELCHEKFAEALTKIKCGLPVMLTGPAGVGKTHMAKQISRALGLGFFGQSCSMGMTEGDLLGRLEPTQDPEKAGCFEFQTTPFLDMAENSGVYLLDEMDAADDNVLMAMNSFLANDEVGLPRRKNNPILCKSKDFVMVSATNTSGDGAENGYNRNELDKAFMDRWTMGIVKMDYDRKIEAVLVPNAELNEAWWNLRDQVRENRLDTRIVSTRTMQNAYTLMGAVNPDSGEAYTVEDCVKQLTQCWTEVERESCGVAV